ncbi:hypothetical protein S245_040419, partial [Arachis hypogaea]
FQVDTFFSAVKKKSSISSGEVVEAKSEIGDLFDENLGITLFFFGGGGQVKISGILNLFAFGVEQPLLLITSSTSPPPFFSLSSSTLLLLPIIRGRFIILVTLMRTV